MLKPIGILAAALVLASLSPLAGISSSGMVGGQSAETAAPATSAWTALAAGAPSASAAAPPVIASISPAALHPGGEATIRGSGFRPAPAANTVSVAGVAVRVKSASDAELVVELPPSGFACLPERLVSVTVRVAGAAGSRNHPLRAARLVELQPGEVATPADVEQAQCVELAQTGGRYWVGVVNTDYGGASHGFRLRGTPGRRMGPAVHPPVLKSGLVMRAAPGGGTGSVMAPIPAVTVGRQWNSTLRLPPRLAGVAAAPPVLPAVGDLDTMRIWKTRDDCGTHQPVVARVVYVGSRSIIYEDVQAPLAGRMNDDFRSLGMEFDTLMWDIVVRNFGDPLALDSRLDADARVRMLFSPLVDSLVGPDSFGYVDECDFSVAQGPTASSNEGEVIYEIVPDDTAGRAAWLREARGITIHELKHVAAMAQRLAQGGRPEDPWLEEGTAMIAQELLARAYSGAAQLGNAEFDSAVVCEYSPDARPCHKTPQTMSTAFGLLYAYLREPHTWSPLQQGWKTYGSGWSMVRWAADLAPMTEPEFLNDLTRELNVYGAENLAARMRLPFPELLVDWYAATVLDDHVPGFIPSRIEHSMQSWNTRDVFRRLYELPETEQFPDEFPLRPARRGFGRLEASLHALPSGSAHFTEITGVQSATQMLELTSHSGSPLRDDAVRMLIVRLN